VTREIKIAPSILAGDLGHLAEAVRAADRGGADQIHLDVIDGHFAPNITFGAGTVKALRKVSDLPFDAHLMLSDPLQYAPRFIEAGSDIISVHAEVLDRSSFEELRALLSRDGVKMGLAIKPKTPLPRWAQDSLDKLDVLLVMTVNPGFSGQELDTTVLPKLGELSSLVRRGGSEGEVDIEVDGGVEESNVAEVVKRGGNIIVAGAGVYAKGDAAKAIKSLRGRALSAMVVK
jgi:ribulose-phosphate 3-epimerase